MVVSCVSVCKYQQSLSRAQAAFSSRNIESERRDTAKLFEVQDARGSCFPHKEILV